MAFTNDDLEVIVRNLRAGIENNNEKVKFRAYQNLSKRIKDFGVSEISNLILISRCLILVDRIEGIIESEEKQILTEHFDILSDVNQKFYQVLGDVNTDSILYRSLVNWTFLESNIKYDFSPHEEELNNVRKEHYAVCCLEKFFSLYLEVLGSEIDPTDFAKLKKYISLGLTGFAHLKKWDIYGLFALSGGADIYGMKVTLLPDGEGKVSFGNVVKDSIEAAANKALQCARFFASSAKNYDYVFELERLDIPYSGRSIELALVILILSKIKNLDIDPYSSFTGCIDEIQAGRIGKVTFLKEKIHSANRLGIKRVYIPSQNADELNGCDSKIEIICVSTIAEIIKNLEENRFYSISSSESDSFLEKIQAIKIRLKADGVHEIIEKQKELPSGIQLWFSNRVEIVNVGIYHNMNYYVGGPQSSKLRKQIKQACENILGNKRSKPSDSLERITLKGISQSEQKRVQDFFENSENIDFEEEKNCVYRAKIRENGDIVYVRQYQSGTLTVAGPKKLFEAVLNILQNILEIPTDALDSAFNKNMKTQAQINAVNSIQLGNQWIGTDESGKGDYFGPLVGAAVLVDEQTASILEELGIRDSKRISDNRIKGLAREIKQVCGDKARVVPISPEKYNNLYSQFRREGKNLNTLLAWAHTRGIENILQKHSIGQITVIVDKFADERYIQSKLGVEGRKANLRIIQLPKAEANVAVAAASVLARAEFLRRLKALSLRYKVEFPKGSSNPKILDIGRNILETYSEDELGKVAKLHFKTTEKIIAKI